MRLHPLSKKGTLPREYEPPLVSDHPLTVHQQIYQPPDAPAFPGFRFPPSHDSMSSAELDLDEFDAALAQERESRGMKPASQQSEGLFVSSQSALLSLGVDGEAALWADRQQGMGGDGSVDAGGMRGGSEQLRAGAVRVKEEEVEGLLVDVEEAEEMLVDVEE